MVDLMYVGFLRDSGIEITHEFLVPPVLSIEEATMSV